MPENQDFSPLIQALKKYKGKRKRLKKVCLKKQLMSDKHNKCAKFGHHQRHSIPSFAKFLLLHLVLISLTHPFKDHVCKENFDNHQVHIEAKVSIKLNFKYFTFNKMNSKNSSLQLLINK